MTVLGSIAAAAQSYFYGPWTTGFFSTLQAAGATAAIVPAVGQLVAGGATMIAGALAFALPRLRKAL